MGNCLPTQARRQRWDEGIGYLERETFEAFLTLPTGQRKAVREIVLGPAASRTDSPVADV